MSVCRIPQRPRRGANYAVHILHGCGGNQRVIGMCACLRSCMCFFLQLFFVSQPPLLAIRKQFTLSKEGTMPFTGVEIAIIVAAVVIGTTASITTTVVVVQGKIEAKKRSTITGATGIIISPVESTGNRPQEFLIMGKNISSLYHAVKKTFNGTRMVSMNIDDGKGGTTSEDVLFPLNPFVFKIRLGQGKDARNCTFRLKCIRDGIDVKGYDLMFVDDICFPKATRDAANERVVSLAKEMCTISDIAQTLNVC